MLTHEAPTRSSGLGGQCSAKEPAGVTPIDRDRALKRLGPFLRRRFGTRAAHRESAGVASTTSRHAAEAGGMIRASAATNFGRSLVTTRHTMYSSTPR